MHLFCCLALLSFLSPCFAADEEAAFLHQPAHPLFYRPKRGHPVPKSDDTGQPINKLEYDSFLESLYLMRDARIKNFNRLDLIMPALAPKPRPTSHEFSFRKFNFSTGIQFEDDFDCDLNLLANCESSLLEKIEKIEGRRVVFTLNRTEEDEVASQFDILNLCRSMDIEFTCLLNYAEKCEKKMRWPTFSILKYIITANNETIVSCRHKEKDWLGGENPNIQEEWVDPNGITHYHSRHSSPCIKPNEIYSCFLETLGYQFDLSRDSLHLQPQCEAALRFEHCIKSIVFENFLQTKQSNLTSPPCSLDEKEATLEILLGSFRFGESFSSLCNELRYRWKRNNSIGGNERIEFSDTYDEAKRTAQVLQSHYDNILSDKCLSQQLLEAHQPCWTRFENRLRSSWANPDTGLHLPETEQICCAQSELNLCTIIYVLLRCGKEEFVKFSTCVTRIQPEQCAEFAYQSSVCQSTLI